MLQSLYVHQYDSSPKPKHSSPLRWWNFSFRMFLLLVKIQFICSYFQSSPRHWRWCFPNCSGLWCNAIITLSNPVAEKMNAIFLSSIAVKTPLRHGSSVKIAEGNVTGTETHVKHSSSVCKFVAHAEKELSLNTDFHIAREYPLSTQLSSRANKKGWVIDTRNPNLNVTPHARSTLQHVQSVNFSLPSYYQ